MLQHTALHLRGRLPRWTSSFLCLCQKLETSLDNAEFLTPFRTLVSYMADILGALREIRDELKKIRSDAAPVVHYGPG
jgi:hypothetical protein